ncbi:MULTISPECIES: hypothetical protein [Nostocaceae]|uniref:hypothetical protein n=1 Tax=Nostocaceae TaxID=1162 RepID=UPI001F54E818|nr:MULTISPECIES: hypothetical protein [Nostocaceae]
MNRDYFEELTDEEWRALASEEVDDKGSQLLVIGGIVAGIGVASLTAFPPAGFITTGWLLYEGWKRTAQTNRNEQAIKRGLIAHVLKGDKLKHYEAQYGTDAVAGQIEAALEQGYNATPDAEELLDSAPMPTAPANTAPSNTDWVQNLVKQTALIWGNQGGGKSWLARYVVKQKKQAGYRVIVLDPDSNKAEWQGVESYHSWEDIEQQIRDYVEELEQRLKTFNNSSYSEEQWRKKLWSEGKATSLICEEATTYGDFIKDKVLLEKFGKLALTKSRKQEMPLTIVSHNNTQSCMFGIKGLYNLVSKMLQVQCLAEVDVATLQPRSTGTASIKLDSSNEWIPVTLPKIDEKIIQF